MDDNQVSTEEFLIRQIEGCENTISELEDQIADMQVFFGKLAQPIVKKAVRDVVRQLRKTPTANSNAYCGGTLDFVKSVCLIQQDSFFQNHTLSILETINSCCKKAYENLNADEKFIINNTGLDDNKKMVTDVESSLLVDEGLILIADAFTYFAGNFTDKKNRKIGDFRFGNSPL